jgi:hypothetical protein
MPTSKRRLICGLAVAAASVTLLLQQEAMLKPAGRRVLAADNGLRWYRGNLHTHTLWSDGDDYPEMVALWYKEHGYDFLCFTDHNTLLDRERWIDTAKNKGGETALAKLRAQFPQGWIEERPGENGTKEIRLKNVDEIAAKFAAPGQYLLIQGEEISDRFEKRPVHMNATNVREVIAPRGGDSVYEVMQRNTDALVEQRTRTGQPMLIHLNHHNFGYGVTAEDLMRVRGENFFEVYNGHPTVYNSGDKNHASSDRIWDIILTQRISELKLPLMYGLGTDDGHDYHKSVPRKTAEPGRGWVMVLAAELTPAALIDAMERGRFYASSGVRLERVTSSPKGLEVRVQPEDGVEYTIDLIGTRRGFDPASEPVLDDKGEPIVTTRRYSDDIGRVLQAAKGTEATYMFAQDDLYVRARITSTKKHPNPSEPGEFERAWTQPALGPAAPPE